MNAVDETPDIYLARAATLCQSKPLLDVMAQLIEERRAIIASAVRDGPGALFQIAEEAAAHLRACEPSEQAIACVGAEIGFLMGFAVGLQGVHNVQQSFAPTTAALRN